MSAMLRAHKAGGSGSGGKARHARSLSLSESASGSSSDSDDAGARLSVPSLHDSPARVRFSTITEEFGRLSVGGSSNATSGSDHGNSESASSFQYGGTPDDDVFLASPVRRALRASLAVPNTGTPTDAPTHAAFDEYHHRSNARSVTTPATLPLGPAGDRAVYRTPLTRHAIAPRNVTGPRNDFGHRNEIVLPRDEEEEVDAQGIYPPTACVFVANLPEARDDRALEAAVTREFSRFGTVFVKIRREGRGNVAGMPYAFAQFTNDEDALTAMEQGRGLMILGRPCRTEMVKANRTFVIYSRRENEITVDVARRILAPHGPLSKCQMLDAEVQASLGLPPAVLVEFATFDPKRDLNTAVRRRDGFQIDAFDVEKRTTISRPNNDEEFLRRYDLDRRSIFVGNLPDDTREEELVELFSSACEVVGVRLLTRTNYFHNSVHTFAFVEFSRIDVPDLVANHWNNCNFRGNRLKVERKAFRHTATPRRVRSQAFPRNATTPRTPRTAANVATPMGSRSGGHPLSGAFRSGPARFPARFSSPVPAPPPAPTLGYVLPVPTTSAAPVVPPAEPLIGASGLPVTPAQPNLGPSPYSWAGSQWPGMTIAQDPITGQAFWAYTPPVGSGNAPPAQTPTRGPARDDQHHNF